MSANLNTTLNDTQSPSCFNLTAEKIGKTFVYCLLFVVSLAGNTFIGIIVYKMKNMRKPINFLIVNMAMSDLLLSILVPPWSITELYADSWLSNGPLGQVFCTVNFFIYVSIAVSIQSLVLIAVDRFGAVVFPLRSPLISSKLCPFYILVTWIIATATSSPLIFAFKVEGKMVCRYISALIGATTESTSIKIYMLAIHIIFIFSPFLLITIIYLKIILKLKSQKIQGEQPVNTREQRVKREQNVLKMSIAIVLVFAVCLFPFTIAHLIFLFSSDRNLISSCGFQYFKSIALVLVHSNGAIKPCICFIFSGNYRQGLKNILGGCSDDTRAKQVTS